MVAEEDNGEVPLSALPPAKGMAETPVLLADTLVRAIDAKSGGSWLDPCAGTGRLAAAAVRSGVPAQSILAIDLQRCLPALEGLGVEALLSTDFLQWSQKTVRRFDRIIANPPFVRVCELESSLRASIAETRVQGVGTPGTGNYWMSFLLGGMRLLNPGGSLGYILPAAWEYADYAQPLRKMCAESFEELDVYRVGETMFEGVADGSIMLVGRRFRVQDPGQVRVMRYDTLIDLNRAVRTADFRSAISGNMRESEECVSEDEILFGSIASISIGAVTGDAQFFLLNEAQRVELALPRTSVRPVLSRARHIVSSEIDEETWHSLLSQGERVWLFLPSKSDLRNSAVRAYLDLTAEDGGCRREARKVRGREPWYRVPVPDPFDGFMTGMSQAAPWVALNHVPTLTASNTLYGVRFPEIQSIDERAAWCLAMLSSATAESRTRLARRYPQGLLKLEPRDMASLVVRRPRSEAGARQAYRQATGLIIRGNPEAARTMADEWLEQPGGGIGPWDHSPVAAS